MGFKATPQIVDMKIKFLVDFVTLVFNGIRFINQGEFLERLSGLEKYPECCDYSVSFFSLTKLIFFYLGVSLNVGAGG